MWEKGYFAAASADADRTSGQAGSFYDFVPAAAFSGGPLAVPEMTFGNGTSVLLCLHLT